MLLKVNKMNPWIIIFSNLEFSVILLRCGCTLYEDCYKTKFEDRIGLLMDDKKSMSKGDHAWDCHYKENI